MLFDNPIFAGWYTDTVDIYRVVTEQKGNISSQARKKINAASIPCRVYSSKRDGPVLTGTPQDYYDPVGGALTQLQHKEVGLLRDNLIGSGR